MVFLRGLSNNKPVDLVLVNCPMRDYGLSPKDEYEVLPPLGLGIIATYAQQAGFNVCLIDAESEGYGINEIVKAIGETQPRFVGINILTPTRMVALEIAKKLPSHIHLLIGAAHATALPEKTVREFSKVHKETTLFVGEAEVAVTKIMAGHDRRFVPGICWIDHNGYQFTVGSLQLNSLENMPAINRSFFANDPCVDGKNGWIETRIIGSRGCPYTCTYCAGSRTTIGTKVRRTPAEDIAAEIAALQALHGVEAVRFVDDLMIIDEKRVRSIMDALKAMGASIKWDATGRANIMAKFSPEFYDYMVANGLHEVAIGIESGSTRMRDVIHKQVTETEIWTTVKALTSRKVKVKCYLIVGIPGETAEETSQTFDLARRLMEFGDGLVRASIFLFRPYPGTEEWNKLIASGWTEDELLEMGASGHGERAKHTVVTSHQYAELSPEVLSQMIDDYNRDQALFLKG
ncbi:B12-binding domain-containing radical SAM protein [Patescibacteria group bacterium]|nr:B12-binding domain-containing radical SAM protein [Patescibacteria group bacterium]